jgi:hypothetical protein
MTSQREANMLRTAFITTVLVGIAGIAAHAQESLIACERQQELEQVLSSEGRIMPDGCRNISVTALVSDDQRLCLLDLSSDGEDLLDQLREAAISEQWWVQCEQLEASAR